MACMTSMVIDAPSRPLRLATGPLPEPTGTDVLIKVAACGVCRTDLHVADGEIAPDVSADQAAGVRGDCLSPFFFRMGRGLG